MYSIGRELQVSIVTLASSPSRSIKNEGPSYFRVGYRREGYREYLIGSELLVSIVELASSPSRSIERWPSYFRVGSRRNYRQCLS